MQIDKLQSKLTSVFTRTPFATDAAKQALLALVMAGAGKEAFLQAIEEHKLFWSEVEPGLAGILAEADGPVVQDKKDEIERQEKYALRNLWANAVQKFGQNDLAQAEFEALGRQFDALKKSDDYPAIFGTQKSTVSIIDLINVHEKSANLRKNNILSFEEAVSPADHGKPKSPKGKDEKQAPKALSEQGQVLIEIFKSLSLEQQNSILSNLKKDKTALKKLYEAKDPKAFIEALGIHFYQEDKALTEDIANFCRYANQSHENIERHKQYKLEALKQAFPIDKTYTKTPIGIIVGIFTSLPIEQQEVVLQNFDDNPSWPEKVLQAENAREVSMYLGIPLEKHQQEVNQLVQANIFRNYKSHEEKLSHVDNKSSLTPVASADGDHSKYTKSLKLQVYADFHQSVQVDGRQVHRTAKQNHNLQDAFALSPNVEVFKQSIANKDNFRQLIKSTPVGGYVFSDYLSDKYHLNQNIVDAFKDMTEAEFTRLKSQTRLNWLRLPNNDIANAEAEKYLKLDQKIVLDVIDAEFKAIRDRLPAFKENLSSLLQKDKKNPSGILYVEGLLEAVSPEKGATFQKTIQGAIAEGESNLIALERQRLHLKEYRYSLTRNPHPREFSAYAKQIEWVDSKIREIETEKKKWTTFLRPYLADHGALAKMESVINKSANTTVRLNDDPALWETFITAVDPAHKPNPDVINASHDAIARLGTQAPKVDNKNRYEDIPKPGEVLEYVVRKKPDSEKVNGIFRKERTPNPKNPSKENISIEIMGLPEDAPGRVITAMRAASEFLKTHVKGQPICLSGRDTEAIADLYFSLLKHGVTKEEITFAPNCAFDPDKHRSFHFWYKSTSPTGKSEDNMKANDEIIESSVKCLKQYKRAHGDADKVLDDLAQKARNFSEENKKFRNSMENKAPVAPVAEQEENRVKPRR